MRTFSKCRICLYNVALWWSGCCMFLVDMFCLLSFSICFIVLQVMESHIKQSKQTVEQSRKTQLDCNVVLCNKQKRSERRLNVLHIKAFTSAVPPLRVTVILQCVLSVRPLPVFVVPCSVSEPK